MREGSSDRIRYTVFRVLGHRMSKGCRWCWRADNLVSVSTSRTMVSPCLGEEDIERHPVSQIFSIPAGAERDLQRNDSASRPLGLYHFYSLGIESNRN